MLLFNELRKLNKLAAKRHPMYEKNKFGKFFMYFMAAFWIGYLIFFGVVFARSFAESVHHLEPYHVLNRGLLIVMFLDFLMRFPFQKTPTQEMKPFLLLPVKRQRLIDFLLIRSGLSGFNLLWLFMFVPFALLTVTRFYGIWGVITYSFGIYLLMLLNNYWYLLCRTLFNERWWWVFLPIAAYGALLVCQVAFEYSVSTFTMNVGEGFITGNILMFAGAIAAIGVMWLVNRFTMLRLAYSEINRVEDTKVITVSEYGFLERYGEIGEYLRLELKMLLRNKRGKMVVRTIGTLLIFFSAALSFMSVYDSGFMKMFILIYNFEVFGLMVLPQLMSFEGNYIDGLMTRKESIYSLLKSKYYFYSIGVIIPFVLLIPAVVTGKLTILHLFAFTFFTTGLVYFALFQLAVYNSKTAPLNEGITGRQATGSGLQSLIAGGTFGVPLMSYFMLKAAFGETICLSILLIIGVAFTLCSPFWIRNVYSRFMRRRYKNMEGFRDSR